MKYPRPEFKSASVATQTVSSPFLGGETIAPKFDTPITPRENFRRAVERKNPIWMPCSTTDFQSLLTQDVAGAAPHGMQIHSDMRRKATEDYTFKDWFNTDWTWVCSAGGAMLTPGTQLLDDITRWEEVIVWPDFSEWGFEERAAQFMREEYNPDKVMHYDLGRGCTERLVSIMGGYTDSMYALAVEPEAVRDFFEAYADFMIAFFDKINSLYPLDMVTLHDDWGTERDTFFSEKMMEELVFEPTKRIVDHIKSKGVIFELHTCGNVTRFIPYTIELGADILQLQRRAVDLPKLKEKYGDKIGFCSPLEGIAPGMSYPDEEIVAAVRRTVDLYAPGGGCYTSVFFREPEKMWLGLSELYAYSRELYDKQQGRE
ncbi:MAG: hypothetical protein GX189_04145 [Clostridiales bacterium]|nr:hypothetical protein [Clostridiales bacterium]